MEFKIHSIGNIKQLEDKTVLNIFKEYRDGLEGLKEGMRILLLLWFDRSDTPEKRKILKVHPYGNPNNPIRGVFSTRSPIRPNPIAAYIVKILKIDGNNIFIEKIDAYDNTPIIDIKLSYHNNIP
ncbi:tRNA (N6-threonylcarbamoyladenosine(37)-N6)-methyltransferase TrmO [Methanothermococcus sp.]|uniref:tRNA (N6-threonylcarbamoyladenosine(37)-N6)-methyltransferase TrmO n=1 Tax=Methanothermococcus sp. TaxID=2614238 RepID=UPI0025F74EE2|nr:tRNA (N6-threonylcarbamoyladenosine(37)-N6)-methyltransferase TrmO [Methanothermococcus sp.]